MIRPEPAADDMPPGVRRQALYPLNASSRCRGPCSRDRFPLAGIRRYVYSLLVQRAPDTAPLITRAGAPRVFRNDWSTVAVPEIGSWTPTMTVSVIIPAFGNQDLLDLTLAGLAGQTYPSELIEVVVVDDGSRASATVARTASGVARLERVAHADDRLGNRRHARDRLDDREARPARCAWRSPLHPRG